MISTPITVNSNPFMSQTSDLARTALSEQIESLIVTKFCFYIKREP